MLSRCAYISLASCTRRGRDSRFDIGEGVQAVGYGYSGSGDGSGIVDRLLGFLGSCRSGQHA